MNSVFGIYKYWQYLICSLGLSNTGKFNVTMLIFNVLKKWMKIKKWYIYPLLVYE